MIGWTSTLLLVSVLVFACASILVYAGLRAMGRREQVMRRYGELADPVSDEPAKLPWLSLDPALLGIDADAQRVIRADLVRAGFFDASGVSVYAAIRLVVVVLLPVLGVLIVPRLGGVWGVPEMAVLAAVLVAIGYFLPKAYISRAQGQRELAYRQTFPDFLDMLVVCINAGLSLEAALDRAGREVGASDLEFQTNLDLMAGEMRAGKSTPDALKSLADRLGLREARSFSGLLQQTIELGTDVAQALTTFSDEMRDKRMSRAEETAAALPPKLTLPLGLFIFPVVLIAVLAPAVLKVMSVVGR